MAVGIAPRSRKICSLVVYKGVSGKSELAGYYLCYEASAHLSGQIGVQVYIVNTVFYVSTVWVSPVLSQVWAGI